MYFGTKTVQHSVEECVRSTFVRSRVQIQTWFTNFVLINHKTHHYFGLLLFTIKQCNCQLNVVARLHLSTLVSPPPFKFVLEYDKIKRGLRALNTTYLFFPAILNLCSPRKTLRSNVNVRTLFVLALQQFRPCPQVWVFINTYKIFIKKVHKHIK